MLQVIPVKKDMISLDNQRGSVRMTSPGLDPVPIVNIKVNLG